VWEGGQLKVRLVGGRREDRRWRSVVLLHAPDDTCYACCFTGDRANLLVEQLQAFLPAVAFEVEPRVVV
jgi:hypothetical protein